MPPAVERQVLVHGTGTVQPRQEISLTPQVSGRVTKISDRFIAGGFFHQGDVLFEIEDADYRLAVDRARAALAKAEYELTAMQGQARIARQEWERLQLGNGEQPNPWWSTSRSSRMPTPRCFRRRPR